MSIEAARNAMIRAQIDPHGNAGGLGRIRIASLCSQTNFHHRRGSDRRSPQHAGADLEFACKAGTEAMVAAMGMVGSGMGRYAMAIGMDTAQGKPGDALEYTAGAGGGAYIVGPAEESLAIINSAYSYVTDTPDFWRREYQKYPEHGMRFTGEPAYFKHIIEAGQAPDGSLRHNRQGLQVGDLPSAKHQVPATRRGAVGFSMEQIEPGLLVPVIGNTYAGAAVIGLTATLDIAQPGDRNPGAFRSALEQDRTPSTLLVTDKITARAGSRHEDTGIHRPPHRNRLCNVRPISRQDDDEVK